MKAPRSRFALFSVTALLLLTASCQRVPKRETVKIGLDRITHIGVGKSVRLSAYHLYRETSGDPDAVYAASDGNLREPITPRWSVSDNSVATIAEDGTITALRPGSITIKAVWGNREIKETIDVVSNLITPSLPELSTDGVDCQPLSVALSLAADRTLEFDLSFAGDRCRDVSVKTATPAGPLPWKFDFHEGSLELTEAHGLIVKGNTRIGNGRVLFTVWSKGTGTYPISLTNKTVLLTGDSMSEGIGWSMKKRVEDAGGRLIVQPWYSSTTVGWQAEGRMTEYVARYNPDIVFIALGSNEIFTRDLEARARAVREINAELGGRAAYWIGPPSWKPDHGIVNVIEENFRPGYFYNSNDLVVPRRKDGAHPTVEGYETWTELIWDWYAKVG
jgi:lysophospholipase L1-like esterase